MELSAMFAVCRRGMPGRQRWYRGVRVGRCDSRIYCTVSPPLSGVVKDCSIVRFTSAAANALSPKILYVHVTIHVRNCSCRPDTSAPTDSIRRRQFHQRDNQHFRHDTAAAALEYHIDTLQTLPLVPPAFCHVCSATTPLLTFWHTVPTDGKHRRQFHQRVDRLYRCETLQLPSWHAAPTDSKRRRRQLHPRVDRATTPPLPSCHTHQQTPKHRHQHHQRVIDFSATTTPPTFWHTASIDGKHRRQFHQRLDRLFCCETAAAVLACSADRH